MRQKISLLKMRKLSVLVAAALLCVTMAHAQSFSTMGIGALTCAQFVERYQADPAIEDRFFDWAQGFMSGLNDALEDTVGKYRDLKSVPTAQQKQILRTFCYKNAAAGYRDGINLLLGRLTVVPSTLKGAPLHPPQR
jgi:HdeA/HdeB family